MKIVIPMAGRGSRFTANAHENPEFLNPKPFISVLGQPMIIWALKSLPFVDLPQRPAKTKFIVTAKDLIFISLKDQEEKFTITKKLKNIFGEEITVILIPKVTRGAAETALIAKPYVKPDEELIVSDSDHYFDGTALYNEIIKKDAKVKGIIPVFKPMDKDPKWSFSLVEKGNIISQVGEKDASLAEKGAYANIGGYYFAHAKLFFSEVEEMIKENALYGEEGKKEFYVAPVFERLIKKGHTILAAITPKVWGLGTPKDLAYFEENFT
ncbi:MAG TPA: hypothetical protein VF820_03240 [Patescibacteria group bacterium]